MSKLTYVLNTYKIKRRNMATVSEIIRKIKRKTKCYIVRHGAEHDIWLNPETGIEFTIPRHPSRELKSGTARNILRAAGLL